MTRLQWKWLAILLLVGLSVFFIQPTVSWYQLPVEERDRMEKSREKPTWLLNLGLDLKGGTHLLLELDTSKLDAKEPTGEAVSRAIEIIRNRVDQFGVAEPFIARQGLKWIVVQLPGVTNPEQAKELIGKTALLEFRLVDDSEKAHQALDKARDLGSPWLDGKAGAERELRPEVAKLLPPDRDIMPGREDTWYVVTGSAALTGAYLKNARVETGGTFGYPVVAFQFNPEGGKLFERLTGSNVGRSLAVILDGKIYSAPTIKSRIRDSGIIEGNFDRDDARNLAIVLRAGALPAPVHVIEERTVGPTLGEDSIRAGVHASVIALAVIIGFMLLYYRGSGFVAVIALPLNLLFLLAGMAYFKSTLTLPGIAGMILTLAIAVDANVLIYERIREELRHGKPVRIAVDMGYDRAFSAILDSHMTNIISSVFLFQFGTGPIKGFAVTLTLGLLISLVTAIFVTKMIFDLYLSRNVVKELSI